MRRKEELRQRNGFAVRKGLRAFEEESATNMISHFSVFEAALIHTLATRRIFAVEILMELIPTR
jgi:hypothetical protein